MQNQSRRNFLKLSALTIASLPFLGGLLAAPRTAKADDASLPPVKEGDGMAASLGYCKEAKKCKARVGKEHADEHCGSCQLYTKVKGDGKTEMGKCLLMPTNLVYVNGWCKSWSKKMS